MDTQDIHRQNAVWWDETASWYGANVSGDIAFFAGGGNSLMQAEQDLLGDLSWCNLVIHLQCSHGNDALSLLGLGAKEVIGVDISERLLSAARQKSDALSANAKWICSDVIDTPHEFDSKADLVYTGKGAICWMMDLDAWASVVYRLLKPGGLLLLFEGHPLNSVWETKAGGYELDPEYGDYFSDKPLKQLFAHKTVSTPNCRPWTLAAVVNSLIGAGLTIERLMEYPECFWSQFQNIPEETLRKLPHTFAIQARKPG